MKKNIIALVVILILSVCVGVGIGWYVYVYSPNQEEDIKVGEGSTEVVEEVTEASTQEAEAEPIHITISAVGDIMMHKWQMERGYDSGTDTFALGDTFDYTKDYLSSANYTVGNLETVFAGKGNGRCETFAGYSCFPCFNAPESFATDIKNAGIDLVGTANNHSLDSYDKGIFTSLDFIDGAGLAHVGTARSQEEKDEQTIVDIDGIKVGFVDYTYDLNGFTLSADNPFAINTLGGYSEDKIQVMANEIADLKANGADLVVAMLHLGVEYTTVPSSYQEQVIDVAIANGADIIFGSHPHVVQPMDIRKVTDNYGTDRNVVIFYSLGNFVSSQVYRDGVMKDIGVLADVDITKDEAGVRITEVRVAPVYTYWNDQVIGVVPVIEAYENPEKYDFLRDKDRARIADAYTKTIATLTGDSELSYTNSEYKYHFVVGE